MEQRLVLHLNKEDILEDEKEINEIIKRENKQGYKLAILKGTHSRLYMVFTRRKIKMWKENKIIAKSALKKNQMQKKMNLGADALEIQLLGEMIDENYKILSIKEAYPNLNELLDFPVESVHAPLCEYGEKINVPPNIEVLIQNKFFNLFHNTCNIAQKFAEKQNKIVKVVLHTEADWSREEVINIDLFKKIVKVLKEIFVEFDKIDICIENVLPIRKINPDGTFILGAGYGFDNIYLVNRLKKSMPEYRDRFYTVLDTCHAEVARMTINNLNKYNGDIVISNYTIEEFFKKNAQDCGLIHLSRTLGNGMGPRNHGQPFENDLEDKKNCQEYMNLYEKYNYHCPIVLEVTETDYNKSDGFKTSREVLLSCK